MELTLLLAPLVAALIASPLGAALGERGASVSALLLGLFAAFLGWVFALSDGSAVPVYLAPWVESGTLSAEISLTFGGSAPILVVLMLTSVALAQIFGITLSTPKRLMKVGDSQAMRLQSTLSSLSFSMLLVLLASGTVLLVAGILLFAVAAYLALDFNLRSVGAGRAAGRALLVVTFSGVLALVAGAALFQAADADAFDILSNVPDTEALRAPLTLAFGLGALALMGALPFLLWSVAAKEVPAPLGAVICLLGPIAAVSLAGRALPFLETAPVILFWLLLATALLAPLMSLAKPDSNGALAAAAITPGVLALQVAFMGSMAAAFLVLAGQAVALLLLFGSYMRAERAGIARIAALVGTLSSTGIGLPLALGPVQFSLAGFSGQGASLSLLAATDWLYWGYVAALVLHALALWKLYFTRFHAKQKKPMNEAEPASAPEGEMLIARISLGLLMAAALIGGAVAGQSTEIMPLIAGLIGAVLAAIHVFVAAVGDAARRASSPLQGALTGPLFLPDAARLLLDAPARAIGGFVAERLDKSLLEVVFEPLTARLFPALSRQAAQAQRSRFFPLVLGAVVAAALVVTIVTMAGS
ncbi:MAG: hypothetical protein MK180_00560 [Rhodobacteraceae bacterium]|nr:hypothetical protein [Paracoccaceae bacterium]